MVFVTTPPSVTRSLSWQSYYNVLVSTYIFVAQESHNMVVALGRQHAECRRPIHGAVVVGWGMRHVLQQG